MKIKNLISPEFRVTIGEYEFTEGIAVECFSSAETHMDWCKITLAEELEGLFEFEPMTPAKVELGYEGDYGTLIDGYARQADDDWQEIMIKNDLLKLEQLVVKDTFIDCTPQDIVRYLLVCAGITNYQLSDADYGKKRVLAIDKRNGIKALVEINSAWGINLSFFFKDGIFYWGTQKEQKEIYILEEDETIMSLERYGSYWEAETLGIPWIHHGQEIEVEHEKFTGTAVVTKTIMRSDASGAVSMYIYF